MAFDYGNANKEQKLAISTTEGPLLIIAGPGTGKTYTLVKRIVYLITEKNVKPEEIMVATFTEKAAKELITRITNELLAIGVAINMNEMYIGTFHSICLRILKEHLEYTRIKKNYRMMDNFDQQYMVFQKISRFRALSGFDSIFNYQMGAWKQAGTIIKYVNNLAEELVDTTKMRLDNNEEIVAIANIIDLYNEIAEEESKNPEVIATKIMQHCLIYLMSPNCPIISIIDDERYCINDMFEKRIKREESNVEIEVGGKIFSLLNTKVEDSSVGGSKIFLYANDRMVKSIDLDKTLVDLDKNIFDDKGFYYVGILTGKYLDDNVEMNRTSFDISESSSEGDISMDDIIAKAKEQVELYLNDYLEEVRDKKNERIRKYISANAPQFGHLLKYMPESINAIKPTLTDAKLDEELYKIKRKFDVELKKENQDILDKIQVGAENLDSYEGKFKEQFEKISEANKAALAEYVSHRKIILELLKKGIKLKDDGKFNKESYIHNLIYPMSKLYPLSRTF